jgi:hypothetical protein
MKNIAFYLSIGTIELFQHLFNFFSPGVPRRWASKTDLRPVHGSGKPANTLFFNQVERPYDRQCTIEKVLDRQHGTEGGAVKNIQEKRLDEVVLVVAEGQQAAPEVAGRLKQYFPPQA